MDTTNINEKVYQLLKERIVSCAYTPGSRIDVHSINDELNISPTPIKQALSRLAVEGLVEISPRRGTYVKTVTEKDIREMFDLRAIIEPAAVEIIANQRDIDLVKKIRRLFAETVQNEALNDYKVFMKRSKSFHLEIIKATGNSRLIQIYEQLNAHIVMLLFKFPHETLRRRKDTNSEHEKMVAALEKNDSIEAKDAAVEHLENTKNFYLETYKKNNINKH